MKLLYKFQVHMDKKKYHLRIFRHEELDLVLLTISDHGKLKHRNWQNSDFIPRKVKFLNLKNLSRPSAEK